MTTYSDVFGGATVAPSKLGYQAISFSADTTAVWPYDSAGGTALSKIVDLTATVGGLSFTFPDATDVSNGEDTLIRNVGANAVTIKDATGATLGTIASGAAKYFYVTDNSTAAGAWAVIAYGVGTSTVDAATLIGYGIVASGASLNQSHPVVAQSGGFTITAAHRAQLLNYTGGTGTAAISLAATLGDNFFTLLRNSGTGVLTVDPSGSEQIDGAGSIQLQPGESAIIACSGVAHYTVGLGRSVTYNFTQLVKEVSAAGSFTLSAAEAANKLIKFIGNPSGACTVVVPNTVAVYYTLSALSTSQTITVKTSAGTGTALSNGSRAILICDGSEVYSAQTADISTLVSLPDGSAAAPSLNFTSTTTTGLYKYGATGFGLAVAGAARITDDGTTTTIGTLSGLVKRSSGVESAAVAGTDYQAADAGLTSIAGLTTSADKMIYTTASDTYAVTSLTTFARSILDDADEATFKATVNLEPGVDVQGYDANTAKLNVAQSWTAKQTFGNTVKLDEVLERVTITASAPVTNFDCLTQAIQYFTANASANWTQNFRGDGSNTLNSMLSVGERITCTVMVTMGATAYYTNAVTIDGAAITPEWDTGSAPTAGTKNVINVYTYQITKTADATFKVLAKLSPAVATSVQTLQSVTGSRVLGTTYTNSTSSPITVFIALSGTGNNAVVVGGITLFTVTSVSGSYYGNCTFVVPAGSTYSMSNGGATVSSWSEIR